jgi:hypothetical protein
MRFSGHVAGPNKVLTTFSIQLENVGAGQTALHPSLLWEGGFPAIYR